MRAKLLRLRPVEHTNEAAEYPAAHAWRRIERRCLMRVALNGMVLLSPLTGIGQYAYHLAQGLHATSGIELDLFYGTGWSQELRDRPVPNIAVMKSLIRRVLPNMYSVSRFFLQRTFNAGIESNHPDIYHDPSFLAFKTGKPSIITVHDLSWIRFPGAHPAARVRAMEKYFEPAIEHASLILTDSKFVKRELIEVFGIRPELIVPVPLGVEPLFRPRSAMETRTLLSRHGLLHGQYLLAVGTLEPRKNLEVALHAYGLLPPAIRQHYPLVVVGMNGWHTCALTLQMAPMIRSGAVRQLGYLSREDLAKVMAGALTLIYPSIYEGFGLPPLEAMACGVPVIASATASLPEVVGDTGLLIDPHDAAALAQAVEFMVSDADGRSRLSLMALARSKEFTWDRCVAQTVDAYRQVLGFPS